MPDNLTPAEIAAKLTPAQVRALRDLNGATSVEMMRLPKDLWHWKTDGPKLIERDYSPLGLAVLAKLDAKS